MSYDIKEASMHAIDAHAISSNHSHNWCGVCGSKQAMNDRGIGSAV
jgi:NADH pyrophosphatase NudC (nudix superfamily)